MLTTAQIFTVLTNNQATLQAGVAPLLVMAWNGQINQPLLGVSTDTRQLQPTQLFAALRGDTFDGNQMAIKAARAGAGAALMDDAALANQLNAGFPQLPIYLVGDTRRALAALAGFWRQQFVLPVIGVCGSNGKTTVKEMIHSILCADVGADYVLATQGNLNNEIGVPLTLFRLNAQHRASVIEMGMNHPGEIAQLAAIAQANVALVNNAQREHQEFMHDVKSVAIENGAVIQALGPDGVAVFPEDDEFTSLWCSFTAQRNCVTFGYSTAATISADADAQPNSFQMIEADQRYTVQLHIAGRHNVRNAMAAAACARAINISWPNICKGLNTFRPVAGRLVTHQLPNGTTLIDDSYNANPDSVLAAIDVLKSLPRPRALMLGDMGEVGDKGSEFHSEIGTYAALAGIDCVITHGELSRFTQAACLAAGGTAIHVDSIESAQSQAQQLSSQHYHLLVKGSRFMRMERVVTTLLKIAPAGVSPLVTNPAVTDPVSRAH